MDFSPEWDCFLSLRAGVVDVAALGTLVDDWPGDHQSDGGFCALKLQLFAPWTVILSMSIAGGILLYVLIAIGTRALSKR